MQQGTTNPQLVMQALAPEELELLSYVRSLSPYYRDAVRAIAKSLKTEVAAESSVKIYPFIQPDK